MEKNKNNEGGLGYNAQELANFAKKTAYEKLGISSQSSKDEIKKAYRKAAFELHPDRHPGDKLAEEKFKLVAEAYEELTSGSSKKMNNLNDARDYFEQTFGFTKEVWEKIKSAGFVVDDKEGGELHDKLYGKETNYDEMKNVMGNSDFYGKKAS